MWEKKQLNFFLLFAIEVAVFYVFLAEKTQKGLSPLRVNEEFNHSKLS